MTAFEREQLLDEGEVITEKIRKHWIVYLQDFFLHAFGCLIFLISAYYLASKGSFNGMVGEGSAYGAMILIMFVLIFWTSFFYAWTKEYFDVWFITNKHIIAINQRQMFDREESFMELNRIQDVFFEREGFLATLFGFGRLKVQSAGTEQEFIIENVRDVETKAHKIMDLRDAAKANKEHPQAPNDGLQG
jgi:uncharacterized membrane protein YdbT with pleckstrin-like domain